MGKAWKSLTHPSGSETKPEGVEITHGHGATTKISTEELPDQPITPEPRPAHSRRRRRRRSRSRLSEQPSVEADQHELVDKLVRRENMLYTVTRVEGRNAHLASLNREAPRTERTFPLDGSNEFAPNGILMSGSTQYQLVRTDPYNRFYKVTQAKTKCSCMSSTRAPPRVEIYVQEVHDAHPHYMQLTAFQ